MAKIRLAHREDGLDPWVNLFGRVLIAIFFIWAASIKILNYEEAAQYMARNSVPSAFLVVTIALELLGGLALLVGWRTQFAALLLGIFSLITTLVFYTDFDSNIASKNVMAMASFWKNMALAGGLFTLASQYPGAFSLDHRRLSPKI